MASLFEGRRGRSIGSGLAVLWALACADGAPGPAAEPVGDYRRPDRADSAGISLVRNHGAAERLSVYPDLGGRGATLLFLGGRAATPLADGGSAWADLEGARVVTFDRQGRVTQVAGGAPEGGPALTRPAFVAATREGLLAGEVDGASLLLRDGEAVGWTDSPLPAPALGGRPGRWAASRTILDVSLTPLQDKEPLLWLSSQGRTLPAGRATVPRQAMLGPLVNSGWVATADDDGAYFASALRPELHRYGPDGSLLWRATWPRGGVREPTFGAADGTLVPIFRVIQQALAVGPDGQAYVLVTRGERGMADRLLVFGSDGTLQREGSVTPDAALYVGPGGHVYQAEAADALARTEASGRPIFQGFELPSIDGRGLLSLEDHRGKVVVVNFWASWCAPCRREMPLLDAFARELDPARAVVLGLNEDVRTDDGLRFLETLGGVAYPIAAGKGDLRARYGYRGLPYTVVLDRRMRVVRAFYGFGGSIDPIVSSVREELAAAP